jgi:hypothetical protein
MVRRPILLAFLLLASCKRAPLGEGLPPGVAKSLETCTVSTGEVRDHCAVTVASHLNLTGAQWLVLCEQLGGDTAVDICVERAAWAEKEPSPYTVCSRITHTRTRQSCLLGATNAIVEGPIPPLVDVCARTAELEADCWVHVVAGRRFLWLAEGQDRAAADVAEAVALRPRLAGLVPFASEVGRVLGTTPEGTGASACDSFEATIPRETCFSSRTRRN